MGTSSEGSDGEGVSGKCSAGTVVWVRRRNGSWWPGKIIGHDELIESHITSLRSGTPVKLLGRDDACVDWYNLKKSKRVKPFRCAQFKECIKMAESSCSSPFKRRDKYARREDAILHALELEKYQLELNCENTAISLGLSVRESNHHASEVNFSCNPANQKSPLLRQCRKPKIIINKDDNDAASLKGKNLHVLKRKTLQSGTLYDNTVKRRDRRRPLVKVLQNSTKLPVSCSSQPSHDGTRHMIHVEEHFNGDAQKNMHLSPDSGDHLDYSVRSCKPAPSGFENAYGLQQSGCMSAGSTPSGWSKDDDFDSSATDSDLEVADEKLKSGQFREQAAESSLESGMSRWHLKGKRNNRVLSKKPGRGIDQLDSAMVYVDGREISPENIDYDTEEDENMNRLGNRIDDSERQHGEYADFDSFRMWKAYWEAEPEDNLCHFYAPSFRMMPMLIDVDLKVQARYQGEHVPLISLTSRLNGMAIVGHPVHIEVLEDGSSDLVLLPANGLPPDSETGIPPFWRTAKRTSMHRPPRSNPNTPTNSQLTTKKNFYYAHRSASGRFQRKLLSASSVQQKTRALSSFASDLNARNAFSGGLIKVSESMPLITCIPIKVVFSRILESVGRPSAATIRRVKSASER